MLRKSIAALAAGAAVFAAPAFAHGLADAAPTESGSTYHVAKYAVVDGRIARVDDSAAAAASTAQNDPNWVFVGGDAGWELVPHAFAIGRNGLTHADAFRHDSPKPPTPAPREARLDNLYSGA